MNDEFSFDAVAYRLSDLSIANAPDKPTAVYLDHGSGLADGSGKQPDLVSCSCTTPPKVGDYCWVQGKNASGEYLYDKRLQCVASSSDVQWFRFR